MEIGFKKDFETFESLEELIRDTFASQNVAMIEIKESGTVGMGKN